MDSIRIRGARTHNLKDLSLELPRNRLVVITGLSGSGKSSLAFDTLYAEGQRRYVESLSAYARQFLQLMEKPDVDLIEGLSPAIAIEQKAASHNPRSTVGTVTEIHDYLRLLFARAGTPYCPDHRIALQAQSVTQMVEQLLALPEETKLMILAPVVAARKGEQADLLEELRAQGFTRVRIDGRVHELDAAPRLSKNAKHSIDVVVDRVKTRADAKQRLADSLETALRHADGRALAVEVDGKKEHLFSAKFACPLCDYAIPELEPRLFSFNNPMGACPKCDGLGSVDFFDPKRIESQDPAYLALAAQRLAETHRETSRAEEGVRLLAGYLERYPSLDLLDTVFQLTLDTRGAEEAYKLVRDELRRNPTLLGLDRLLEAQIVGAGGPGQKRDLELVRSLVHGHTRRLARYRCEACGFKARQFYWRCPACGGWETYPPRRTEEFELTP